VTRSLQLLELPAAIQADIAAGRMPPATALELTKLDDPETQDQMRGAFESGAMSAGDVAEAVKEKTAAKKSKRGPKPGKVRKIKTRLATVTLQFKQRPTDAEIRETLREALERFPEAEAGQGRAA
jgi:hypothetical protein